MSVTLCGTLKKFPRARRRPLRYQLLHRTDIRDLRGSPVQEQIGSHARACPLREDHESYAEYFAALRLRTMRETGEVKPACLLAPFDCRRCLAIPFGWIDDHDKRLTSISRVRLEATAETKRRTPFTILQPLRADSLRLRPDDKVGRPRSFAGRSFRFYIATLQRSDCFARETAVNSAHHQIPATTGR